MIVFQNIGISNTSHNHTTTNDQRKYIIFNINIKKYNMSNELNQYYNDHSDASKKCPMQNKMVTKI